MTQPLSEQDAIRREARARSKIRLRGPEGTDLVNHGQICYTPEPDGTWLVPPEVAEVLTNGVAGFVVLPPVTQARRLATVFDSIKALDPGPIRTALWSATIEQSLRLAGLPASSPSPAPAA